MRSWIRGLSALPVLALAALAAEPDGLWHSQLSLGMNLAKGNTESQEAQAELSAKRETTADAWTFDAEGAYAESDEETTKDRAKVLGRYDQFFSERLYGAMQVAFEYDGPAAVHQRIVFGPSLGAYAVRSDVAKLALELGPSFVSEDVGDTQRSFVAVRVGERFERDLGGGAKLWQAAEYLPELQEAGNYLVNAEAGVEAGINADFSLKLKIEDSYNSKPAEGKEDNDVRVISAVCYKL